MTDENIYSFDLLKDSVLHKTIGNRLIIETENEEKNVYLRHIDRNLCLSEKQGREEIISLDGPRILEEFFVRKITKIDKDFKSLQERIDDLPYQVALVSKGYPYRYDIFNDDEKIVTYKKPSTSYAVSFVMDILNKDLNILTAAEIAELKRVQETASPVLPIFDEEVLFKEYPKLYYALKGIDE